MALEERAWLVSSRIMKEKYLLTTEVKTVSNIEEVIDIVFENKLVKVS